MAVVGGNGWVTWVWSHRSHVKPGAVVSIYSPNAPTVDEKPESGESSHGPWTLPSEAVNNKDILSPKRPKVRTNAWNCPLTSISYCGTRVSAYTHHIYMFTPERRGCFGLTEGGWYIWIPLTTLFSRHHSRSLVDKAWGAFIAQPLFYHHRGDILVPMISIVGWLLSNTG